MRVLLVEDHAELACGIAEGLRDRGFATDVAYDGRTRCTRVRCTAMT
jgi:DNA-binding response OmpR family regulator